MAGKEKDYKRLACQDALIKLNEAFTILIENNCFSEAVYVLWTMKDIVEKVDDDYYSNEDDD